MLRLHRIMCCGLVYCCLLYAAPARAGQGDSLTTQTDSLMAEVADFIGELKHLKISGYVQAQWLWGSLDGEDSRFSGVRFYPEQHSRFTVRRAKFKFVYSKGLAKYTFKLNATETGVQINDAYLAVTEPWSGWVTLSAGIFDRPFGFEIPYSSSQRESPERSRFIQTLFPGERDMGAALEVLPAKGAWKHLNFKAGIFAGSGMAEETDDAKDFIGRVGGWLPYGSTRVDAGISFYTGAVRRDAGAPNYTLSGARLADSTYTHSYTLRRYYGADLRVTGNINGLGAFALRFEGAFGTQPASRGSSVFYRRGDGALYRRDVAGWYLLYSQFVAPAHQLVVKYDVFDPNTNVSGETINTAVNRLLSATDLRFNTLGLGYAWYWDANVKLMAYYEFVTNEKAPLLAGYEQDLDDDVFTLRLQFRF